VPRVARWDDSPSVEQRVAALVGQMTNEEKADLATGELNNFYGFYNNPIPRLGIPALTMADGPVGVRVANPNTDQETTQLPSGSSLAATFDRKLARTYGDVLGREAFATGHNVVLGPTLDISRTPLWGRAFEGLGEDPLVSGTLGSQITAGIQAHPVLATLKHPFAYNQETDRFDVDAQVSDRALHEIYLRPFEITQKRAHPGSMMCSFNKLNGTHACEHPALTTILKRQLRFRGFVMSDYNATPSTVQAANNGLDQEQPGDQGPGTANFGERLVAAVAAGEVSQARLDDMASRILRPMIGLGLFERPTTPTSWDKDRDIKRARQIAARGMVLLRNHRGALPLRSGLRSIAVIGPDADNISAQGGGSSEVSHPTHSVSPLEGIRAATTGSVTYRQGVDGISEGDLLTGPAPVPSSVLSPASGPGEGLSASYWSNDDFSGDPHLTQVDPNVNVNFGFQNFPGFNAASPKIPTVRGDFALLGDLSARWQGTFTAPRAATYTLGLTARGNARLYLDGQLVVDHTGDLSSIGHQVTLAQGQQVDVRIEYAAPALNSYQGGQVRFFWQHPEDVRSPMMQAAVDSARRARVAVVVVRDYETEGYDRPSLSLPKEQEQLIRQVAAVNPRTIVVVETGTATKVSPWIRRVAAAVQAWYPGQEQGNAIADVLFGRVNPSGHLPVSVPTSESQVPAIQSGTAPFTEDVRVGYRGMGRANRPTFAFGHGLSYTKFRYSGLRISPLRHGSATVRVTVRNVGDRAGVAVPQVYVGRLPGVRSPWRQLVGFDTVRLRAGRSAHVRLRIPQEELSTWSSTGNRWVLPRGTVRLHVGSSVERTPLDGRLRLR
jgi:beta-glucosidase